MAKVKNTGHQPRGFITEEGNHVVVKPGEEKEFNMTEADFKHLQSVIEGHDDPKPFEIGGSHGGVKEKKATKDEVEMPAQSTEPPSSQPHQEQVPSVSPMTDKEKREREQSAKQKDKEEAPSPRR